jgi:hypothetical protein
MTDIENPKSLEQETHLGLKGALKSFEGTALIPTIRAALEAAAIRPYAYDLEMSGHAQYFGFPATCERGRTEEESELSPIVKAIFAGLEEDKMILEYPERGTVHLKSWSMYPADGSDPYEGNAFRTAKLFSDSLLAVKDVETDEVLAYAASLSSDGGRKGYAFISTNDVIPDNMNR